MLEWKQTDYDAWHIDFFSLLVINFIVGPTNRETPANFIEKKINTAAANKTAKHLDLHHVVGLVNSVW